MGLRSRLIAIGVVSMSIAAPLFANDTTLDFAANDGWIEHKPGGRTLCARGGEYSFFVYPGASDKVIIDFIGGGACWNENNCDVTQPTFYDSVEMLRRQQRRGLQGIYDKKNLANPLLGWTHVVVPYCTGDIHWGDSDTVYTRKDGTSFTINHRGAVNAKAVLSWVKDNIQPPEQVLSTGCSAGSYGSIYWTPAISELFPKARLTQFGDSGAGVVTREFMQSSIERWNIRQNAPTWIPSLDPKKVDWRTLTTVDIYTRIGAHYPRAQLGQFNAAEDLIQTMFYTMMGGEQYDWNPLLRRSLSDIEQAHSSFRSFTASGAEHCVLPHNYMYETSAAGHSFVSWFKDYVDAKPVNSVECLDCAIDLD